MIRYIVTTYRDGVANLSRPGSWGNRPFPSPEAARYAARVDAAGVAFTITQEASKRRRES